MGTTTGATAGGSNIQNNVISIGNTKGRYFSHFSMIGANLGINHVKRESNHVKPTEFEKRKQKTLTNG